MNDKLSIQSVDVEAVDSLESYMFTLAMLCVSVQTLYALQTKAEKIGIFDADEIEMSKTVKYQTARLFQVVDDLLRHCTSRTNMEWDKLMRKVLQTAKKRLPPKKRKLGKKRAARIQKDEDVV